MVITDLEHIEEQLALTPALAQAVAFLRSAYGQNLPAGRTDLDGDRVFALVQVYDSVTPPADLTFEGHRKYIDVQFVDAGEEIIGWAHAVGVKVTKPYDEKIEAWLGTCLPLTAP